MCSYYPKFANERKVTLLDGTWEYGAYALRNYPGARLPEPFDSMDPSLSPSNLALALPNHTQVPSVMDAAGFGELGLRGVAFYRTTFDNNDAVRLQFQSCSFYCRIWVDDKLVGWHHAGEIKYVLIYISFYSISISKTIPFKL